MNYLYRSSVKEAMLMLGFDEPKWASGYIIGQPPHSPLLYRHQDWWGWDDPSSYL